MSEEKKTTLIFVHILKTAGTTLTAIIEKNYPAERTAAVYPVGHHPDGSMDGFKKLTTAQKENIDILYGHMSYGLHEYLPRPAIYFTILRDPIERVISRFYHIYRDPHSPLHDKMVSGEMDLAKFSTYMKNAGQMDNLQTRMIAGNWDKRGYGECTEEMLATAKENLREKFAVVGITERFDETCILIQREFGWKDMYYEQRNVTKKRPQQESFSADILEIVKDNNQYDIALYAYGLQLFKEKISQQGESFEKDVRWFRWKNGPLKPLHQLYWRIRKVSVRVYIRHLFARMQN